VSGAVGFFGQKGSAKVELADGWAGPAEIHWYEAHGIGRREVKIKRLLR
jgi:hypothetical protein